MFNFSNSSPLLSSEIIKYLSQCADAEAEVLKDYLDKNVKLYTIQSVYSELRALQDAGIVVKQRKKYSLKMTWILSAANFVDEMFNLHVRNSSHREIIPAYGKTNSWKLTNLGRIDDFWEHCLLTLLENSEQKYLIGWTPHPWYYMTDRLKQKTFEDVVRSKGRFFYRLLGGRTFLDNECAKLCSDPIYKVSQDISEFEEDRSNYFDIIDDFVFNIKFDKKSTEHIESFFSSVKSMKDRVRHS